MAERETGSGPGDRVDRQAVAARSAERSAGLTARERIADEAGKRQWVLGIVGVNAAHASAVNGRRDR